MKAKFSLITLKFMPFTLISNNNSNNQKGKELELRERIIIERKGIGFKSS